MGGNFLTMPGLPCGWTTVALGAPYPSLGVRIVTLVGVFPIVLRQGSHSAEAAEEYMEGFAPYVAIAVGGVLGANARYLVGLYFADRLGAAFPYGTLVINVTGSLVIGFFLTLISERLALNPLWRLFFATGFLGAYTTFSTYTYEAATLIRDGAYVPAFLYVMGSVVLGLLGVLAGIAVAERL